MTSPVESVVPVLMVEPEMSAQLDRLEAIYGSRARVDLTCVATCGGALQALSSAHFDCLLLSTYLCLYPREREDLLSLVRRARACGVAVLAFGAGDPAVLGVPVHDCLGYRDVTLGKMNDTLARARACADLERRFASGINELDEATVKRAR